jgi:hypothetical protein
MHAVGHYRLPRALHPEIAPRPRSGPPQGTSAAKLRPAQPRSARWRASGRSIRQPSRRTSPTRDTPADPKARMRERRRTVARYCPQQSREPRIPGRATAASRPLAAASRPSSELDILGRSQSAVFVEEQRGGAAFRGPRFPFGRRVGRRGPELCARPPREGRKVPRGLRGRVGWDTDVRGLPHVPSCLSVRCSGHRRPHLWAALVERRAAPSSAWLAAEAGVRRRLAPHQCATRTRSSWPARASRST